jgi:hypothetical protein
MGESGAKKGRPLSQSLCAAATHRDDEDVPAPTLRHTCVVPSQVSVPHAMGGAAREQPMTVSAAPILNHCERLVRGGAARRAAGSLTGCSAAQNGHAVSARTR